MGTMSENHENASAKLPLNQLSFFVCQNLRLDMTAKYFSLIVMSPDGLLGQRQKAYFFLV